MALTGDYEPSAIGWVGEHVEQIMRSGMTDGATINRRPTVLLTYRGAKKGEHEGRYAAVASKGGEPAVAGRPRLAQRHRRLLPVAVEERLAVPEHEREEHEMELIDEVGGQQRARQLRAAVNDDVSVDPPLERLHRGDEVAVEHGRVVPRRIDERLGDHVLRHRV